MEGRLILKWTPHYNNYVKFIINHYLIRNYLCLILPCFYVMLQYLKAKELDTFITKTTTTKKTNIEDQ